MPRTIVHIDAVRVRATGVSAVDARALADGLGEAIVAALAARTVTRPGPSHVRIPELNLGRIAADGGRTAGVGPEVASRVADAVAGRTGSKD